MNIDKEPFVPRFPELSILLFCPNFEIPIAFMKSHITTLNIPLKLNRKLIRFASHATNKMLPLTKGALVTSPLYEKIKTGPCNNCI